MVHTFQALGVNVAVDVNSGAVHVAGRSDLPPVGAGTPPYGRALPGGKSRQSCPSTAPMLWRRGWQELRALAAQGLLFEEDDYIDRQKAASNAAAGFGEGPVPARVPRLQPAVQVLALPLPATSAPGTA